MATCVMKQLREKHVSAEITKCVWSPKMDLIAIANVQGQVTLHRLSWQQVWTLNSPIENTKVTALAWRTDSKVLAIGYSSGKILLVNIEDSSTIHELNLKGEVSSLLWSKYTNFCHDQTTKTKKQEDPWAAYMYPLPPLSKSFGDTTTRNQTDVWQEPQLLQDQTELNVLCIGSGRCSMHLYAFGLFHIATVNIADADPYATKILNITPTHSLDMFSILIEREDVGACVKHLAHFTVLTPLISSRQKEIHYLAQKYGQIYSLMTYISHTLTLIEEAWESALIEMDAKLAAYAASVPEGGVSADFLDLLVFGHASAEFEIFLTNKLTEKNLKKLRQSVDLCYSTMQRLVVKHLQQVGVTLVFLLSQVEGMSRRKEQFSALGVIESEVEKAMGCVGSFLLKASEMLQAIESSMKDFHIFVRWVSSVHLRLLREHVPPELSRMSQQETASLLSFLNDSFEEVVTGADGERRTHFRLERAGQYLKKEHLKTLPRTAPTPFANLVNSNASLAAHRLLFVHNPRTSLLQEHQNLTEALTQMGAQPGASISASVQVGRCMILSKVEGRVSVAQVASPEGFISAAILSHVRSPSLIILEWPLPPDPVRGSQFVVRKSGGVIKAGMLDAQFYSPEILSLLLFDPDEARNPLFAQVNLPLVREQLCPLSLSQETSLMDTELSVLDMATIPDILSQRRLETGLASAIAVSGSRKVAAVIGENRRRIRIYEMEADEDDEEETEEATKNESALNVSGTTDELNDTF